MYLNTLYKILALGLILSWLTACSVKATPNLPTPEFPIKSAATPTATLVELTPTVEISQSAQPEETLPNPLATPQEQTSGLVTIWHSWNEQASKLLLDIVRSYQKLYPRVSFDLLYLPETELFDRYASEAYQDSGPTLVLGPSQWGAQLYDQGLVENLLPYVSDAFREVVSPPALASCSYHDGIFGIPYAQSGVLLYRNQAIIPSAPETFEDLVNLSKKATKGGVIGAYLERGAFFSLANLYGLGGQLIDDRGDPAFNQDNYGASLKWIQLLADFSQVGATEINGNQHLVLFEQGKVGFIIDGSWRMNELSGAIGAENLVIDKWPMVDLDRMSGFVQSDVIFLNPVTKENSDQDFSAALSFIGYMLTPQIQGIIEDAGFIPVRKDTQGSPPMVQQAVIALEGGVPYPPTLNDQTRPAYFDAIDATLMEIFEQNVDPLTALQSAFISIKQRLAEIRSPTP